MFVGDVRLALHYAPTSASEIEITALLSDPYENEEHLNARLKELNLPETIAEGDSQHIYPVSIDQLEGLGFLYLHVSM